MRVMLQLVKFIKEHKTAILSLAAAVATYTVAVNLALIKEKLHAAFIAIKTAALHVHKVAVLAASVAYNRMTGNVVRANAAMKLLNATMMMNPWGLVAGAIVGVGVALYSIFKNSKDAANEQKKLTAEEERQLRVKKQIDDHNKAVDEEYAKQAATVTSLTKVVNNSNLSLEKRREALKRLQEIVPDYHASLTDEGKLINDNKEALDNYLVSLKQSIRMKMNQEKLEDIATQQIPIEDNIKRLEQQNEAFKRVIEDAKRAAESGDDAKKKKMSQEIREMNSIIAKNNHQIRSLKKQWQELEDVASGISIDMPEPTKTKPSGDGQLPDGADDKKAGKGNKFQKEDDWREREQALNRIAYAKGTSDYEQYNALKKQALKAGVNLRYETTAGAALPILETLDKVLNCGDRIRKIEAAISGTLGYIFDRYDGSVPFEEIVEEAHRKGYTEPDPAIDLSGRDVLRKLLILSRQTGIPLEEADVDMEPVPDSREIARRQAEASAQGLKLRYIASLTIEEDDSFHAACRLECVSPDSPLYWLRGTDNAAVITTEDYPSPLLIQGAGAGARQTAGGVLGDILACF